MTLEQLIALMKSKVAEVRTLLAKDDYSADDETKVTTLKSEIATHKTDIERLRGRAAQMSEVNEDDEFLNAPATALPFNGAGTANVPTTVPAEARATGREAVQRLSDTFMKNKEVQSWLKRVAPNGNISEGGSLVSPSVEVRSLITGASNSSAGAFVRPEYDTAVDLPRRPLNIRDVITVAQTGSDLVMYPRQVSRTNNAAVVDEAITSADISASAPIVTAQQAGQKPESGMAFELAEAVVKTIPTWMPITRQALADAPQMRSIIDDELTFMVEEKLQNQIVAGDGTGSNFLGILNTPGLTIQPFVTDIITTTRKALTRSRIVGRAIPTAWLMNPVDAEAVSLLKGTTGAFYFGGPAGSDANPTLWGKPIIECEDVPAGTALTGDLRLIKLWDRMNAQLFVSDSHKDFFTRNIIAVLCELRAALGVKRPAGIVKVALA